MERVCSPPPGLTRRANAPQLPEGGLGTGGIDSYIRLLLNDCNKTTHHTPHTATPNIHKRKKKLVEKERQQKKAKYASIK